MGNSNKKQSYDNGTRNNSINRDRSNYFSQFSLSSFANTSGRSAVSAASFRSTNSASRPWSRVSRRGWHENTLSDPLEASKTAWPVPHIEALFLPEFKVEGLTADRDFAVINIIAKGAYGKVYKVLSHTDKQVHALKVLSKSQVIGENAVKQVKDEVHIQNVCGHHPFIVRSSQHWQNRRKLFIVSDYVPGGELLTLLHRVGKLPEDLVRIFVAEIALALDFLHNAGIIYRDLKPENILLDASGHIQLIDFGLSKWLCYGARTNTLCGTLRYMAPEIAALVPYGHAADWWSLGVLACLLLTDRYPVSSHSSGANISTTIGGIFPVPIASRSVSLPEPAEQLSNAARDLLNRLLQVDPLLRLRNIRMLQQIAFYVGFSMDDIRKMNISPKHIIDHLISERTLHEPASQSSAEPLPKSDLNEPFRTFDMDLTTESDLSNIKIENNCEQMEISHATYV